MSTTVAEPEFIPDFPVTSDRQIRRAITRGVLRVAITAVAYLVLLSVAGDLISGVAQSSFGRRARFERVVGIGWAVAHPGYSSDTPPAVLLPGLTDRPSRPATSDGNSITRMYLYPAVSELTATGSGHSAPRVGESWLGHVSSDFGRRLSEIDKQSLNLGADHATPVSKVKQEIGTFLESLPKPMTASAVIEFLNPLSQAELNTFEQEAFKPLIALGGNLNALGHQSILLSNATNVFEGRPGYDSGLPLAWPRPQISEFQSWVETLKTSDQGNLLRLGLPKLDYLRQVAADGKAHGMVVGGFPLAVLKTILADPRVRSVRVADLAFSLPAGPVSYTSSG